VTQGDPSRNDIAGPAGPSDPQRATLVAAAEQLGIGLTPDEIDKLLGHLSMLARWNRVYNLTALREPHEMLGHHLIDCLAAVPALRRHAAGRALSVLDVGSGGGLPGVVFAVVQPTWTVTCVDTVGKKAGFIRQVAVDLKLRNLQAVHSRVEAMARRNGHHLITSRAFASLADFVTLTRTQLADGGVWLALKGRQPDDEIAALPKDVEVFHVEHLAVPGLDAQRCLVWLRPASTP
jgi:16S rRNA (guanine527-N7)-methyltransferase